MDSISISTAASIATISKRTLWRRISESVISVANPGSNRDQTMLNIDEVLPLSCLTLEPDDRELILQADRGDPAAESDLALMFFEQGMPERGVQWLEKSAKRFYPDAMYQLGRCLILGEGATADVDTGIGWLKKSSSHGFKLGIEVCAVISEKNIGLMSADVLNNLIDDIERGVIIKALETTADAVNV